ncbi:hypothetical protein [Kitasatospora sp. NPDC097643]|uniref:hypothetical protein n=1 Tax=Kitasatospora sp. NPDC097643 TaxID=3157230 RepID=UPI003324B96D
MNRPARPRIHWSADLLLSLLVLLATGTVIYAGAIVIGLVMLTQRDHTVTSTYTATATGAAILLLLAGWTARGCWRLGYRIAPYVTAAAPFLWPLGFWLAVELGLL